MPGRRGRACPMGLPRAVRRRWGCRSGWQDVGGPGGEECGAFLGECGCCGAVGGFLGQGGCHRREEVVGGAGEIGFGGHDAEGDDVGGPCTERQAARGGVGDQGSPGEDVPGGAGGAGSVVLGADPAGGAGHDARARHGGAVEGVGDAEVDHARAGGGEHHVRGFDVAVDESHVVDGREGRCRAGREGVQVGVGERSLGGDVVAEGVARDVCGGEPGGGRVGVGGEEGDQALAGDPPGQFDLSPEAGAELVVVGLGGVDELECDAASLGVQGGVDGSHSAGAEASDDSVGAYTARVSGAGGLDARGRRGSWQLRNGMTLNRTRGGRCAGCACEFPQPRPGFPRPRPGFPRPRPRFSAAPAGVSAAPAVVEGRGRFGGGGVR